MPPPCSLGGMCTNGHLGLVVFIAIPEPCIAVVETVEVAGWIARMRHECLYKAIPDHIDTRYPP